MPPTRLTPPDRERLHPQAPTPPTTQPLPPPPPTTSRAQPTPPTRPAASTPSTAPTPPGARPSTVLITGASSGIGRALALEYARGGARVVLCARRESELEETAAASRALGGFASCIRLDVTDVDAVAEAVRRADRDLGGLDMVIANAGRGDTKLSTRLTWDDVGAVFDVNARGAMATLLAAIPVFLAQKHGHLVGITSLAGVRGLPTSAAYSASKAALSVFLESLRIDLAPTGIRVTDVQPGFVATSVAQEATHPVPFRWPVDRAARHIVRRLETSPAVVAFPWPLVLATRFGRMLPAWLYDRVVRAQSPSRA
jgi:NADP-dependent 3-hydroxy acid dehydrogenase YdfG